MENYKLKNGKMKNYKKTKNLQKTSKTTPERPGTPFKRRGMQNYVLFFRNYAFTVLGGSLVQKHRKIIRNHVIHNKTTKTF